MVSALRAGPPRALQVMSARRGWLWYRWRVLPDISFRGPAPSDPDYDHALRAELPPELQGLLDELGGVVAFGGGLHLRGLCVAPEWHSLRAAWRGPRALHQLFRSVLPSDVPFAEDCVGDQYLLRGGEVVQLFAEVAEVEALGQGLREFIAAAIADPEDALCTEPLQVFLRDHEALAPECALQIDPPFCVDADERTLVAVPRLLLRERHAALAQRAIGAPS